MWLKRTDTEDADAQKQNRRQGPDREQQIPDFQERHGNSQSHPEVVAYRLVFAESRKNDRTDTNQGHREHPPGKKNFQRGNQQHLGWPSEGVAHFSPGILSPAGQSTEPCRLFLARRLC
jgi:hypothetical protein